jgi:hypothetical protein
MKKRIMITIKFMKLSKLSLIILFIIIGCSTNDNILFDPSCISIDQIKNKFTMVKGVDIPAYSLEIGEFKETYTLGFSEDVIISKKWLFDSMTRERLSLFLEKNSFKEFCELSEKKRLIYNEKFRHVYLLHLYPEYEFLTISSMW